VRDEPVVRDGAVVPGKKLGLTLSCDHRVVDGAVGAAFLAELRRSLAQGYAISVTGLMDWASQAAPEDIDALAGTVDELIFQTYRGRETVPEIDAYLARLSRLHVPFRLGLAEGAAWSPPAALARHPHFLGYVVFLRNPPQEP